VAAGKKSKHPAEAPVLGAAHDRPLIPRPELIRPQDIHPETSSILDAWRGFRQFAAHVLTVIPFNLILINRSLGTKPSQFACVQCPLK
jgi:hypothetical protein